MPGPRRRPVKKEKLNIKALKKVLLYSKKYIPALVAALIFATGGAWTTIIGPDWISQLVTLITSGITTSIDMNEVYRLSITLALIYVGGSVMRYVQQFITATITQKTAQSLRRDIDEKLNRLPLSFFDTSTIGDLLSRITNDVDVIGQSLGNSLANLISSIVLFFGVLIMMFTTNWVLSIVTILSSLLGLFATVPIVARSQKYFNRQQSFLGEMNGQIEDVYSNHDIVNAYGAVDLELERFERTNDNLFESNWKAQFISGLMNPIMSFVGNLSYALIFIVGVYFILEGNTLITLGTLISFTLYSRLFSQPLTTFAQSITSLQQASAAANRVFELLDAKEMDREKQAIEAIENPQGQVSFDHVKFRYLPDVPVIKDFSADLKKGQKIAIVGPTGAGKTTLVNLLMRFYDPQEGRILIDGVDTKEMTREQVHDLFNMILQDTWLFEGTVRENLLYNSRPVDDQKLDEVVEAVGLTHFIQSLPQGYDTVLDSSLTLSEGQKQQLTIARAILKNAPLLILDEATSSVDTRTELVIQKAMDELMKERTSFVIAHRLSTIRDADIILVVRDGDIVEKGNHEELLKQNGFYAELYNSQFAFA